MPAAEIECEASPAAGADFRFVMQRNIPMDVTPKTDLARNRCGELQCREKSSITLVVQVGCAHRV
jgi:hypothetical protein